MKYTLTVLMFLSCHIRILELIYTSWLPEYQGAPGSKQARYLKFRWLHSFSLSSASVKLASFCFWFRRKTTLWRKVYLIIRNSFGGFIHNQVSVGVQWLSKHLIWVLYFKFTDLWIHLKKKIFVNDFLVIYLLMSSQIYLGFFCLILWQKFFVSSVKASIKVIFGLYQLFMWLKYLTFYFAMP